MKSRLIKTMLFYFNPMREAGNGTENMCVALVIETPGQPETVSEVMQFFRAIDSSLTSLANGGYQVATVRVVLSLPGEDSLQPPASSMFYARSSEGGTSSSLKTGPKRALSAYESVFRMTSPSLGRMDSLLTQLL